MGRHSKPSTSSVSAAKIAVTGAIIGSGSVALAAQAQAAPDSEWDVVARCESSGNWAINTGNGYQGGLQFSPSTWLGYGGGQFASAANLASKDQQIAIAEKVLAGQGRGAWPVCGRGLSGPTPRNLAAAPKAAPADAVPLDATPLDATPLDATPLDAVVPDPASATGATPEIAPEIVAVDVVTEDPAAPAAPAIPAAPADQAVPVDQAQPPAAAAPEIVEIDVVTAEPADPANPASDVVVTETDAVATGPSALEVMSAATGDAPVAPSMTQEVSFLREIWQAMRDQNLTADDMLAAMAPEPGQ